MASKIKVGIKNKKEVLFLLDKMINKKEYNEHMELLKLKGLEQLQKDGIYLKPWYIDEEDCMDQQQLQQLFNSTDWKDGVTAFYQDIIKYLEGEK